MHYTALGYTGTDPSGSYPTDSTQGMGPPGGDIDPGSMGQMASSGEYGGGDGYGESGFEEELPLLVELGIDFDLIKQKVCVDSFGVLHVAIVLLFVRLHSCEPRPCVNLFVSNYADSCSVESSAAD